MINSKTILALVFLIAGALLTTTAVTTIVPAAYADDDHDGKNDITTKMIMTEKMAM
jgi:hypothetical protein